MNTKVSSLKEQVGKLRVGKAFVSAEVVTAGVHRDKLNDELPLQLKEFERFRVTLSAKTDFVELLKRRMVAREASFVWDCKEFEARLAETKLLPDEPLTETTTRRDWLRGEVDHLSSVSETANVEVEKALRELTGAQTVISLPVGKATTQKRSAQEAGRRLNDVQNELDGARARVTQLMSLKTRRREQVHHIIRRSGKL